MYTLIVWLYHAESDGESHIDRVLTKVLKCLKRS